MDIRLFLGFSTVLLSTARQSSPPPPPPSSCSDQLVLFSPCLPYISSSPNNMTNTPPPQCCDEMTFAVASGNAICLCYLVQRPRILGFPVNSSRVISLSSVCPMTHREGIANFSIKALCSGKTALPPLKSITGSGNPPHLSGQDNSASPQMSPPQQHENRSSSPPPPADDSSVDATDGSSIEPTDGSSIGPADDSSTGPGDGSSVGPGDDSSVGPGDGSSVGPADDSSIGADGSSIEPPDDSSIRPHVRSPTITITPIGSASTTGRICIICLCISLGFVIFLFNIFIWFIEN
ncbi:PREDICTED: caM kinase-like vesicle-associated protein [Ipomoea nil]|uniref:caM kinase-like vesicle-associated protein n=1 Tax=Ipomoea nil TaxID=35883 RepID=UPI000900EB22|nr:PREDICTED: caM kinase-like vesicle-associated protein [Ipomoea nil]